jgi:nucleoside-diphosphate-sugar epimerase
VVYAAQADNIGGRDLRTAVGQAYPTVPVGVLDRPDAGGISIAKARALLGWDPHRSWRDYLDADGHRRVPAPHPRPTYPGPVTP